MQNGYVNTLLYSLQSIEERSFIINMELVCKNNQVAMQLQRSRINWTPYDARLCISIAKYSDQSKCSKFHEVFKKEKHHDAIRQIFEFKI